MNAQTRIQSILSEQFTDVTVSEKVASRKTFFGIEEGGYKVALTSTEWGKETFMVKSVKHAQQIVNEEKDRRTPNANLTVFDEKYPEAKNYGLLKALGKL